MTGDVAELTADGRTPDTMTANPENFALTLDEVKRVCDGADGEVYGILVIAFCENGARRIVGHVGKADAPKEPWVSFQAMGNVFAQACQAMFDPLAAMFTGNPIARMMATFGAAAECSYDGCPGCEHCDPEWESDDGDDGDDDDPDGFDLFKNGMVF